MQVTCIGHPALYVLSLSSGPQHLVRVNGALGTAAIGNRNRDEIPKDDMTSTALPTQSIVLADRRGVSLSLRLQDGEWSRPLCGNLRNDCGSHGAISRSTNHIVCIVLHPVDVEESNFQDNGGGRVEAKMGGKKRCSIIVAACTYPHSCIHIGAVSCNNLVQP